MIEYESKEWLQRKLKSLCKTNRQLSEKINTLVEERDTLHKELDTQREWSKKMFNDQEEIIEGLTTLLVSYGKPYKEGDTERELWLVEKRFKPHVAAGGGAVLRVFGAMREELK